MTKKDLESLGWKNSICPLAMMTGLDQGLENFVFYCFWCKYLKSPYLCDVCKMRVNFKIFPALKL